MRLKSSCNTSINSELLNEAKSLDIKLSEVFESALAEAVKEKKKAMWFKQNANALQEHNQKVMSA
ncbi:MAG: type II toxin-antitoxin system CcdA family antitoxin [Pseudomonadota bacterium]